MNALALGKADFRRRESGKQWMENALGEKPDEVLFLVILNIECHILEVLWEAGLD